MNGKNYFLAISIDEYQHFTHLNNAVKDVEEIIDILTSLYQFEMECIHRLPNEEATEDRIDEKFLELVDLVTPEDNLIVFYSGHGYYRENVREGYWVPVNGRKDKISDYITNANLIRYLQNIKAHHIFIIVDSCFSGALVEQLRGESASEYYPSRRVFASGRTEMVSDGLPGENSPFAKGIIDFLKANREKSIGTTELINSVQNYVTRVTSQCPIEGRIRDARDNRGEFFFKRKLSEEDFWIATLAKDSLDACQKYLKIYPEGKFSPSAYDHLRKKIAEKAWSRTKLSGTQDDYEDFILMHASSDFAAQAKAQLELLKKAELERKKTEEERTKRVIDQKKEEEDLEYFRKTYKKIAREAKQEMDQKNYRFARKKFWQCEEYYMDGKEGFVPNIREIRESRDICTKELLYEEYSEDGKRAFKIRDYRTAIQLFQKAIEIMPNDEEAIRLRNAANSLLNATGVIDFLKKGLPPEPAPKSKITIRRRIPAKIRPRIIVANKGDKPKRPFYEPLDLTFVWISLLIGLYFIILKLIGIV